MSIQIWEVEFGNNVVTYNVVATSAEESIPKAKKLYQKNIKDLPEGFWVSKVELIAESDE